MWILRHVRSNHKLIGPQWTLDPIRVRRMTKTMKINKIYFRTNAIIIFSFFFVCGWKFLNKEWNKSLLNHFIIIIYKWARPGYTQSLCIGKADEILWYSVIFLYFWTKPIRFDRVLFELIPPWLSGRPEPCGGLSEYFITDPHLLSPWLIIFTLRLEIRNPGISAFALAPARGIVGRFIMERILMAQ